MSLLDRLRGTTGSRISPHPGPVGTEQDAASSKSGALRAAIFGLNDGLVSNLSLIFGVAGSGVDRDIVVIAGIAGLLAGAFSMAAGEYVSMKVQREVFEQLIHKEAHEIATMPEEEERELAGIFEAKGISPEMAAADRCRCDEGSADRPRDPRARGARDRHAGRARLALGRGSLLVRDVRDRGRHPAPALPLHRRATRPWSSRPCCRRVTLFAVGGRDDRAHRAGRPLLGSADARDRRRRGCDHVRRRALLGVRRRLGRRSRRVPGACRRSTDRRGRIRPASSRSAPRPRPRARTARSPRSRSGSRRRPPSGRSRRRADRSPAARGRRAAHDRRGPARRRPCRRRCGGRRPRGRTRAPPSAEKSPAAWSPPVRSKTFCAFRRAVREAEQPSRRDTVVPVATGAHLHLDVVERRLPADTAGRRRVEVPLQQVEVERAVERDRHDVVLLILAGKRVAVGDPAHVAGRDQALP